MKKPVEGRRRQVENEKKQQPLRNIPLLSPQRTGSGTVFRT